MRMMIQRFSYYIVVFSTICCSSPTQETSKEVNRPTSSITTQAVLNELVDSVVLSGDEKAYNRIANHYILNDDDKAVFFYSFIMAHKYNNGEAYFHLYLILSRMNGDDSTKGFEKLDTDTKDLASFYLLKSFELSFKSSKFHVRDIFGDNVPSSEFFKNKLCEKGQTF